MTFDVIVVGSGPAAVHVATALVEGGREVLMLDVGNTESRYAGMIPPRPFREIRTTDPDQHRYLLGERFEGIPTGRARVGAQLTPPRQYVLASEAALSPLLADNFAAAESLALGGLGNAWGAGVFGFDAEDLRAWPLALDSLAPHYEAVARRIGIAAPEDDLTSNFGGLEAALPPLEVDAGAQQILARYARRRAALHARGFRLGQPPLAVCTSEHRGRGPHSYSDMDYWADADRSVYRPRFTVEELSAGPRFSYRDRHLVLKFLEDTDGVLVEARDPLTGTIHSLRARMLVLAAGTLGTARIVLRSVARDGARLPLLSNPYTYAPAINFGMLGRTASDRRHSLAQLASIYRKPSVNGEFSPRVQTQVYSYRSLLTFKLLREAPMGYRDSLRAIRLLLDAFAILAINHADTPSPERFCTLGRQNDSVADALRVQYSHSESELRGMDERERGVLGCFRSLGCWPIRRIRQENGASIHYAGTLPMRSDGRELSTDVDGRLAGTQRVRVVDGSVFPDLPAKGLTFTIMANANRVGARIAQEGH